MKKAQIKELTNGLLQEAFLAMQKKIDKAINSGALDINSWDENINPMILPKVIVIALLEDEAKQYNCKGTSFEKQIKKNVNNLKNFI